MSRTILEMKGITKSYSETIIANNDLYFSVDEGEIHALVGENGAGKTTLMKILYGLEKPDRGTIQLLGKEVSIHNPSDAMRLQIGMVNQHFMLVDNLTVAENVVLGMEPKKGLICDRNAANELVTLLSKQYDMPLDPNAKIEKLNVSQKQKVEIIKVLARKAKIIILDEPTAVLTPLEIKLFFKQLLLLREAGHTIIIITHKIKEIMEICDRVTIMKSGIQRGTYKISEVSEDIISKLMVGFEFKAEAKPKLIPFGMPILQVKNLNYFNETGKHVLKDINLSISQNQILGIIGIEGSGQQELVRLLSGELKRYYGEILINSVNIKQKDTLEIRRLGVGYIPEDRMKEGVNLYGNIIENGMAIAYISPKFTKFGLLKYKLLEEYVDRLLTDYEVKFDSHKDAISSLSGGNMQKIVCGREIDATKSLLIANQPTRGIDIGSILAIHKKIKDLQKKDIAILLISSDLSEIYQLCKSVIVMFSGEVVACFDDIQKITEDDLGAYMLGLKKQAQKAEVN